MWLAPIVQFLTLTAMGPPTGVDPPASTQALPEPIATRQTLFAIPFRVERPDQAWREPVEVQLYVSADRGATWDRYSRVDPMRRQFVFRAGSDDEYWFAIRTLDRSGQLGSLRIT